MALAQTDLAELKRFTFFVSRRFEEGRERFRLHMGYFATLAEAEEWLNVVREIYPGAWAGEAPGRKLRERAAAAQAAQAQHAAGPQPSVSPPRPRQAPLAAAAPPPAPSARPEPEIPAGMSPLDAALSMRVPVLKAAPPAAPAPAPAARPAAKASPPAPVAGATPPARKAAPAAAAPMAAPRKPAPAAPAVVAKPAAPTAAKAPAATPAAPKASAPAPVARAAAAATAARSHNSPAAAKGGEPAAKRAAPAKSEPLTLAADDKPRGVFGDSNVREVLKALGDASATGETRLMRAPLPPPAPAPEPAAPSAKNSLSDTQVLKLLETRRPEGTEPPGADPAHGAIPLLKPDDTGTREALKEAVTQDAPVLFAVQLQWSVQPVELEKVPPLAIFSAYTLYTVEGSRDGRKWFGLRLGFFSDAISAKQVAHYVRSEFASVAVVPVSAQEKGRATDQDKQAATLNGPVTPPGQPVDEFKLIDDDTAQTEVAKLRGAAQAAPAAAAAGAAAKAATDAKGRTLPGRPIPKVAVGRAVTQPTPAAPAPAAPAAAAVRGRGRTPGRVGAGEKRGAQSLEETLEILGAGQLSIDNGSGETLNESGVRHLRVEVQKNSPFSKLLERLSERMKKP